MKSKTRRFFSKHAKSSAAFVTLGLHAVFLVAGLSLVVITHVVDRGEEFTIAAPTDRPRAPLPRMRPPSAARNSSVAKQQFERVKVKPRLDRDPPPIALPAMNSFAGSMGSASGGSADGLSAIGFATPEFNLFNVRGKGEKIFLILDAGDHMLEDKMGGIPAYDIIKSELNRIVDELPSTAVFNVCVFGRGETWTRFPKLVPANAANAVAVERWLAPLNAADASAATGRYGTRTLGEGGTRWKDDFRTGAFSDASKGAGAYRQERWFAPAMVAMTQRADTIFLLTNTWGFQRVAAKDLSEERARWMTSSEGERWLKAIEESKAALAEENRRRRERGEPPRVIAHGNHGLVAAYRPDAPRPPTPGYVYFTPREFQDAFKLVRAKARGALKLKDAYTFNVVRFAPVDAAAKTRGEDKFKQLVGLCGGGYQTIAGLEAIRSYVKSE